ncbi:MAG: FMN-binding protein [Acidobacteria bacterium]|nr:FMN-binding protein [Acidobacteriota bacterium]
MRDVLLAIGVLGLATASAAAGPAGITRDEALAAAFPGAVIKAEQVFLTAEQQRQAASLAGVGVPSALVARYVATKDGQAVGRAYVDTHVVRTKKESLLISLDAGGRVKRIDVTAFLEPPEYRAPHAWAKQHQGRPLDDDLRLHRAIRPIAGATLTARAVTEAVRRVLAIDGVLSKELQR